MLKLTKFVPVGVFFAVIWPASPHAGEVVAGRVEARHGNDVHLCFLHDNSASTGDQFTLSRHVIWSQPKGPAVIRPQTVGTVKIDTIGPDHCANATLTRGSVQPADWVVRSDNS